MVVKILRAMTPDERLAAAVDASASVLALTEAGIRARHPDFTEPEVRTELSRLVVRDSAPAGPRSSATNAPRR